MKKIIVPIDFSEHSEYALKTAADLAKRNDAEILALHMLEMSDILLTASGIEQNQKTMFFYKLAEQKFETFLDKPYLKGVKVTPLVKHFKVFSEVNDVALKYKADIIIMGSQGTNGVTDMFVGSNTERVVRTANIPVLVVKNNVADINFEVVVLACDFSEESIKPYLNTVAMFKNIADKLYLVHVNLATDRFKSTVEIEKLAVNFFMKADKKLDRMKNVHYVCDYTVEDGILNFSNKIGADLIVVPTHGRTGLSRFFVGSIGEDVANHSTLPVLTFKI
ncbi:universal stress protein UspA [Pseudalgibacter alginicilyticus]|uniref:Universal stress protein UspA n=1 Tax=Pseudalgibacter alginicilyticus TaxID=1736674 RepID=A0A0P0D2P8_9FLAO|nr:universal stress protein [Pseudalgibacter alginicilyticus]ALJ05199.1 universal stress protein UspA [Pseudalgibacter alginicilyticus]